MGYVPLSLPPASDCVHHEHFCNCRCLLDACVQAFSVYDTNDNGKLETQEVGNLW